MKIKKEVTIKGVLTTESGLSIGTKNDIGISASDNPVIKNPINGLPYIPGSSIKGKMRSLFEMGGIAKGDKFPCSCGRSDCLVCKLFGSLKSGNARLIFRDAFVQKQYETMDNLIETKYETAIDRNLGTAQRSTLRQKERVSAGVGFNYEIVILIYEGDNETELIKLVENGLRMIESTGLGSKVSAGYGKVNFHIGEDTYKVTSENFVK